MPADIPEKILTHNLYGLEIDRRAGELAAFALVMKAREKHRRFFRTGIQPHICVLENIHLEEDELKDYQDEIGHHLFTAELFPTLRLFEEADHFGSLIRPMLTDVSDILHMLEEKDFSDNLFLNAAHRKVLKALQQVDYLSPRYHVVVANPPYMGRRGMNDRLKAFADKNYKESKSDLFAMFIERGFDLIVERGYNAMVTMQSWMFLSSFEKLRTSILDKNTIISMAHLGPRAFDSIGGEVVSTTAFVMSNEHHPEYKGAYLRLVDGKNEAEKAGELRLMRDTPYRASAADFKKIPGSPMAYWVSKKSREVLQEATSVSKIANVVCGMTTGDNDLFVRLWHEVSENKCGWDINDANECILSRKKWFPYNKGGEFRKWCGNNIHVINWENNGKAVIDNGRAYPRARQHYFKESITWTFISSSKFGVRLSDKGFIFDMGGCSAFPSIKIDRHIIAAFLCTKIAFEYLKAMNPTLNFQVGNVRNIPWLNKQIKIVGQQVKALALKAVSLSRTDWDSYETSWDFTELPLLKSDYHEPTIRETYQRLRAHWWEMTREMQRLEEENNRIFIEAYGLQDELTPEVPLSEITLTCNPYYRYGGDKSEEELEELLLLDTIKEYISYAVGCMFGRYSLDEEGLVFAGGDFDPSVYKTFPADQNNVIPILADDYFSDDIVTRFVDFVRITFGEETLEENLNFIADTLGRRKKETARDTIRRYF